MKNKCQECGKEIERSYFEIAGFKYLPKYRKRLERFILCSVDCLQKYTEKLLSFRSQYERKARCSECGRVVAYLEKNTPVCFSVLYCKDCYEVYHKKEGEKKL